MSSYTYTNTTAIHKQKAKMLVEMANAVEDSNTRRRHLLYEAHTVQNAQGIHRLMMQEHEKTTGSATTAASSGSSTSKGEEVEEGEVNGNSNLSPTSVTSDVNSNKSNAANEYQSQHENQYQYQNAPVSLEQMRELYTAMIQARGHADLRYQMLELRYLALSESFLELEARYRRCEAEKEVLKRSCDAMANMAAGDCQNTNINNSNKNNNTRQAATFDHSSTTGNSTVPAIQQELQGLHSQRHNLLQANLELRKHLKQLQQHQNKDAGGCCPRCHPDVVFAPPSLHRPADFALQEIVERFHSNGAVSGNDESDDNDDQDEHEYENNKMQSTRNTQDARKKHQDNLSLLGMQYASKPKNIDWAPPQERHGILAGSMRHIMSVDTAPRSYSGGGEGRGGPSNHKHHQSYGHYNSNSAAAAKVIRQSTPTLTSILPGISAKTSQKNSNGSDNGPPKEIPLNQGGPVAGKSDGSKMPARSLSDLATRELQDIELNPQDVRTNQHHDASNGSPPGVARNLDEIHFKKGPTQQMEYDAQQEYGMFDEFGRSISRRNVIKCQDPFHAKSGSRVRSEPLSAAEPLRSRPQQPPSQQTARRHSHQQAHHHQDHQVLPVRSSLSQAPHPPPNSAATFGMMQQQHARYLESMPSEQYGPEQQRQHAFFAHGSRLQQSQDRQHSSDHHGYYYSHDNHAPSSAANTARAPQQGQQTLSSLRPSELQRAVSNDSTGPPVVSRTRPQQTHVASPPSQHQEYRVSPSLSHDHNGPVPLRNNSGSRPRLQQGPPIATTANTMHRQRQLQYRQQMTPSMQTLDTTVSDATRIMSNRDQRHRDHSAPQQKEFSPPNVNQDSLGASAGAKPQRTSYFQRIKQTLQQEI